MKRNIELNIIGILQLASKEKPTSQNKSETGSGILPADEHEHATAEYVKPRPPLLRKPPTPAAERALAL
ncbi:hypothetical protein AMTR_s00072p00113380 [Amborella trichopoda]|uniref:Uncharacterized protein n=1 Tax=Amborella trichopoda TaxID=13333 RepID=W1NTF8_AMBTC|nr:hypothetical protein AMTR_s00072p00113380 [Amborella trichopoda]